MRFRRFQNGFRLLAIGTLALQALIATGASVEEFDNPTGPGKNTVVHLTPIDFFRILLAAPPEKRDSLLGARTPEQKKTILAKIDEYEKMPAAARELRLRHTELRWHLLELMKTPAAERPARLAEVPSADRPLMEERLRQWDALGSDVQDEFLKNQAAVATYLEKQAAGISTNAIPNDRQKTLDEELSRLEQLPENQRQRMCDLFRQFFDWDEKEKQKTLNELSPAQREQIMKAMQGYAGLTPEQRQQRIEALRQFLNMTPAQRKEFLENAARWQAMSPSEQALWRQMVKQLPPLPPMPSRLANRVPPMPPPPLPSGPLRRPPAPTNTPQ